MNFIKTFWQLPQNIAGLVVKKIYNGKPYITYKDVNVYTWSRNDGSGVSLGEHIFVPFEFEKKNPECFEVQQYIKHEYGHCVQSKYFGWLYLFVIALPSLIWAGCFEKYRQRTGKSYYWFPTEKWADKLGGVSRNED